MQTGRLHWRASNIHGADMDLQPSWGRRLFGKRADFRPLQFGKKDNYRPLQFGKRAYERYPQMIMRHAYSSDGY
ncbi:hypothetical protein AAVH_21319 [Aphelenchoides avenae]|nr:hypothetical protein AAVH_21319 [Aphelenchus avenae]